MKHVKSAFASSSLVDHTASHVEIYLRIVSPSESKSSLPLDKKREEFCSLQRYTRSSASSGAS